jgi:hypothetical protein
MIAGLVGMIMLPGALFQSANRAMPGAKLDERALCKFSLCSCYLVLFLED